MTTTGRNVVVEGEVNSLKRQLPLLERQASLKTEERQTKQTKTAVSESAMPDNPPESVVTLSVRVADGGVLSIAEDQQQGEAQLSLNRTVAETPLTQPVKGKYHTNHCVGRALRPSARGSSSRGAASVPTPRSMNVYRTVHFTLCVSNVMKTSQRADGSSQVELRPLGLGRDPRLPPLYGCIDGRGELQLSMGDYNQNALGKMASLVAAVGLEEDPGVFNQSLIKRVVVLNGKTWPTFPVAVTILDHGIQTGHPMASETRMPPDVASTASQCIGNQGKSQAQIPNVCTIPRLPMPAFPVRQVPSIRPVTSTIGVLIAGGPQPAYPGISPVARYRCMPVTSKTAVLLPGNENNSASNDKVDEPEENRPETPKLQRLHQYGSTESVCSIDTPRGRLYIAEHSDTPPPLSPQVQMAPENNYRAEAAEETATKHQLERTINSHRGSGKSDVSITEATSVSVYTEHQKTKLPGPSASLDYTPADPTEATVGGNGEDGTKRGTRPQRSESDSQTEGVANFLSYLQEMNKLMESVLAGRPVESPNERK